MKGDFTYRRAIALEHERPEVNAPLVSLKAERSRADEIVKIAKRFGIPVVEDRPLARALSRVEINQEIPSELFRAVALVLHQLETELGSVSPRA